jgi:hypothetical protein
MLGPSPRWMTATASQSCLSICDYCSRPPIGLFTNSDAIPWTPPQLLAHQVALFKLLFSTIHSSVSFGRHVSIIGIRRHSVFQFRALEASRCWGLLHCIRSLFRRSTTLSKAQAQRERRARHNEPTSRLTLDSAPRHDFSSFSYTVSDRH